MDVKDIFKLWPYSAFTAPICDMAIDKSAMEKRFVLHRRIQDRQRVIKTRIFYQWNDLLLSRYPSLGNGCGSDLKKKKRETASFMSHFFCSNEALSRNEFLPQTNLFVSPQNIVILPRRLNFSSHRSHQIRVERLSSHFLSAISLQLSTSVVKSDRRIFHTGFTTRLITFS